MADYDSNMIKPVEGLQNFSRLNPTGRREERKRRQQLQEQNDEENGQGRQKNPSKTAAFVKQPANRFRVFLDPGLSLSCGRFD